MLFLVFGGLQAAVAQQTEENSITVVKSLDDVSDMASSEEFSFKFTHSLNFATAKGIEKMAIEEFKKMAAAKGFTHVYIDEDATGKAPFEMHKRDYTVVVVGKAFKG